MNATKRLLVVEDDTDVAAMLVMNLREEGYSVEMKSDGEQALAELTQKQYDLLLLDVMLPGIDGLELCRRVRSQSRYLPIIMLSSRCAEIQRIVGLEMGADDYMAKPFSLAELIARVRALLRRVDVMKQLSMENSGRILVTERLRIDAQMRTVTLDGTPVSLTSREFELLYFFARHPGRTFTRMELLNQVWGYNHDGYEHTVNSHINRLRGKIETDPADPTLILTVWGVGYKFVGSNISVAA